MYMEKVVKRYFNRRSFEKFIKNDVSAASNVNNYLVVVKYFLMLFAIDYSGVMDLWGQSYVRRCINMFRRRDPLTYEKKLKPFCEKVVRMLTDEQTRELQSINIPDKTDMPWITRRNTTTHQCCENYSDSERLIIENTREIVKEKYSKIIGEKLYSMKENKATIYVYHGKDSQHLWHVDPQNINTIFNVIICIGKEGDISPLQCKDKDGKITTVNLEPGDAAIFNGGTTVHQVPPNKDPNSKRTVLSMAFTNDPILAKRDEAAQNMCTYIEGGNNYINLLKMCVGTFVLNYVISYLAGVKSLSYTFVALFSAVSFIIAKYVPGLIPDMGSNRASSYFFNIQMLLGFMLLTLSVKGGSLFFLYYMLSDVFFSPNWVAYD